MHTPASSSADTRRAVSAAVVGNVLEWYDFAVYAYVAVYIARKFFPPGDEVTALLSTFLAYGLGFVARPLGGIIIGRIGDTHGRKLALLITIALMAGGTVLIGILPTYASIGALAPLLLVFARLLQGFSAGGEWGSSTAYIVEWAPKGQRGFYGSFQQMSVVAGLLLGSGVAALLTTLVSAETMDAWGWRVPFLLGAILGPVGMYMRRTIDETPAYRQATATPAAAQAPSESGFTLASKAFGFTIVWTVCFYVLLSYMPTYTQRFLKITAAEALWANTIGLLVLCVAIPIMGKLSDQLGRKPLLLACCVAFIVLPYPTFTFLLSGASYASLVWVQILFAVMISMFSGAGPAAIAEMFPTRSRSTWMTTGYALAVAIFGGFAPFISVWLIDHFKSPLAHTFYLIAAAIVSTVVILGLRETAHEDLR
jgi:MHS family proline/betaine transporter-like MFS transporter